MSLLRIETPRLLLRPFSPTDAAAVVELDADPDVVRFMKAPQYSEAEMTEVIARYAMRYEDVGFGLLAGVLQAAWLEDLPRLIALIAPDNHRSRQLAERVGLLFERDVVYQETRLGLHAARSPHG